MNFHFQLSTGISASGTAPLDWWKHTPSPPSRPIWGRRKRKGGHLRGYITWKLSEDWLPLIPAISTRPWVCASRHVYFKFTVATRPQCCVSVVGCNTRRQPKNNGVVGEKWLLQQSRVAGSGRECPPGRRWYLLSHQEWLWGGWCLEVPPLLAVIPWLGDGWCPTDLACQQKHLQNERDHIHWVLPNPITTS